MIRYRPTYITPGKDDLLFHLERFRMGYARQRPRDPQPPPEDESSEDGDEDNYEDDAFLDPSDSPYDVSHYSSSDCDGESEPEFPSYLRDGDERNYRTRQHPHTGQADREGHCNPGGNQIESAHPAEQTDSESAVCGGLDDCQSDGPDIMAREIPSHASENSDSLTPTGWQITLNTAFDRLRGCPSPPAYLYQLSPAPSDFTLPSLFSVQTILCDNLSRQAYQTSTETETPRLTRDITATGSSLGHSTYLQLSLPPHFQIRCGDQVLSKQPSFRTRSMALPEWTPINRRRSRSANASPADPSRDPNRNTTVNLPLSLDEESHMHGHLDKITTDMSRSSSADSDDSAARANTGANTNDTRCPCYMTPIVRERSAMVSTENNHNHRVRSAHPGMVAPPGRRFGSSKASDNEFVAPVVIEAKYFQRQATGLAQELQVEVDENADDYGLAMLRSRPFGCWYRRSSAAE